MPANEDSFDQQEIAIGEKKIGVKLPSSIYDFYSTLARNDHLAQMHNVILPPSEFEVVENHIVFMIEAQGVVSWGIRKDTTALDPPVYQIINCDPPEVYPEDLMFSDFIKKILDWQAGFGPSH